MNIHRNSVQQKDVKLAMANDDESGKKKETTWDRITGPKLFKTVTNWEGKFYTLIDVCYVLLTYHTE